jgi:mono/diheme cytochrome c family protein
MNRFFVTLLMMCLVSLAHAADSKQSAVKRGQYIVDSAGCAECHTPFKMGANGPEPDMALAYSGHPQSLVMPKPPALDSDMWVMAGSGTNTAFAGPWGISYAANITSDKETGIGTLREIDFINAMQTGKHLGVGRPIMPPMPWSSIKNLSDSDLKAVFAYLQSLPPIHNKVPEYQPPM